MAIQLLPLLLAAAGTGISLHAQDKAAKDRQRLINQQAQKNNEWKRKQNNRLTTELEQYNPENRQDNYEDQAGQVTDSLASTIKNTLLDSPASNITPSIDYGAAKAKASAASAKKALKNARLMGRANGISRLFQQEGSNLAHANTDMMMMGNFSQGDNNLYNGRINAVQPNSLLTMLGSGMTAYGTNKAGSVFK